MLFGELPQCVPTATDVDGGKHDFVIQRFDYVTVSLFDGVIRFFPCIGVQPCIAAHDDQRHEEPAVGFVELVLSKRQHPSQFALHHLLVCNDRLAINDVVEVVSTIGKQLHEFPCFLVLVSQAHEVGFDAGVEVRHAYWIPIKSTVRSVSEADPPAV